MLKKIICSSLLATALVAPVFADTTIVNENFDSYADTAAFVAVWGETTGLGTAPALAADGNSGIITSDATVFPGIQGNAIDHIGAAASAPGMVNQFGGVVDQTSGQNPEFTLNPTATESVVLKADIYFSNVGNERMTVGLRHIAAEPDNSNSPPDADTFPDADTSNILEMGQYNAAPTVTVPGQPTAVTGFAYRLINFGTVTSPITAQPNWQYFALAPELDRASDLDTITSLGDIGAGWHTYTATISDTSITLTLDLFRDGKTNLTRVDGTGAIEVGVGADGVDASITYDILTQAAGFNALRIGGPSGLFSGGTGAAAFDNINLSLVDVVVEPPVGDADFDGDGDVDGRDFLIWQRGFGTPDALPQDGDADLDNDVDGDDLVFWQAQYNETPPLASTVAVPEPAVGMMILTALGTLLAVRRR